VPPSLSSSTYAKSTSEIIVDVSVVAAIFALDVTTNTWKKDDNAVSNVTIFHQNQPTGVIYQFIGQSKKTNEVC
jgi:hypothetical protein